MLRVIIERRIKPESVENYLELIRSARKHANHFDGFIAGELLQEKDNPNLAVIISSWESIESWNNWFSSNERLEIIEQMRPFLEDDERIIILENSNILG